MQSGKRLTLQVVGAVAVAMLVGTSAFAESRHQAGTSRGSSGRIERGSSAPSSGGGQWHSRGVTQSPQRYESRSADRGSSSGRIDRGYQRPSVDRSYEQRSTTVQRDANWRGDNADRGRIQRGSERPNSDQSFERRDARRDGNSRGDNVERGRIQRGTERPGNDQAYQQRGVQRDGNWRGGNESRGGVNGQQRGNVVLPRGVDTDRFHRVEGWHSGGVAPYRPHEFVRSYGRVERYERWNNGYRVWCGGLYPIFVPFDVWARFPLRVGLYIGFGGYWDPFGYWTVNDYSPYYGNPYYYYDGPAYTSGTVHGVVESVDYRRGTMVINDDVSRQFVTVEMPRDRRMNDVRPGDYVEFSGDWTRGGLFDAYRLERWDYGRDGYRGDYRDDDRY